MDSSSMSEMKRSSYYVLFLGAKESKGLRGPHYVEPVLQYFISQEHRMQALKITLQVNTKGLRIIPHSGRITGSVPAEPPGERHFIPHSAITCVFQAPPPNEDIISCILMIYNPDTNCPVHVHSYRCDSPETAAVLRSQLEALVNRDDNQRKFRDIESRLQSKGLFSCPSPIRKDRGTPEFDCRTSDSSENSDRGFGSGSGTSNLTSDRVASLYDSLAAELRAKLNARKRNTPLLLPPRDYDTMHRQRGNLSGIETRRCSNPAVVGASAGLIRTRRSYASREQESCGRSSGIGSAEDNCSPIHDPLLDAHPVPSSSDDEDFSPSPVIATERSQFLVRPTWPSSPGPVRAASPLPPPLPKRPELRQRSPDMAAPPPLPIFSKEKFEGVRQKWEKLDHQYVRQKSQEGPAPDEAYRSREVVDADYRRQLSRESLLRSLSRSKTGSRDSLDRWVENGVRYRGMWRKTDEEQHANKPAGPIGVAETKFGVAKYQQPVPAAPHEMLSKSPAHVKPAKKFMSPERHCGPAGLAPKGVKGSAPPAHPSQAGNRIESNKPSASQAREKSYRELREQERFPGLDRESARPTIHGSQQHIYSEPLFDNAGHARDNHSVSSTTQSSANNKPKKFSFAFWK